VERFAVGKLLQRSPIPFTPRFAQTLPCGCQLSVEILVIVHR
jgi:hypothetical protein